MKFYCLHEGFYQGVQSRLDHFQNACSVLALEFNKIDSLTADYTKLPPLHKDCLLYNVARGSETLESLLLNESVTTFYKTTPKVILNQIDATKHSITHHKENIPAPNTIFQPTNERMLLRNYVDFLKGFPIVIKTTGGSLGIGAMIVNNYSSLFSLTDYLCSINAKFIFRQYIEPKEVARLIVVGSEVVASNKKFIAEDDFRTSVKTKLPEPKKYSNEIEELAVKASHLANSENGGVDILIGTDNKPYVLEVNMPHDFVTTANVTKIEIAKLMLEYLIKKANGNA